MQGVSRTRFLLNKNRQFAPYRPERYIAPVPVRATASPAEIQALRNAGIEPLRIDAFEREGASYPLTLPQFIQTNINLDDIAANLAGGAQVPIAGLRLAKGTAADRFAFLIQTTVVSSFELFRFSVNVNGVPFIQEQFFTQPFQTPREFFRVMDSESIVEIVISARPGMVIVPPLGRVITQLYIDSYQSKFRG